MRDWRGGWQKRESTIGVMDATCHSLTQRCCSRAFFFLQERELFPCDSTAVWRRRDWEHYSCLCRRRTRTRTRKSLVLPVTWTIGHSNAYKTISPARARHRCSWKHMWTAWEVQQFGPWKWCFFINLDKSIGSMKPSFLKTETLETGEEVCRTGYMIRLRLPSSTVVSIETFPTTSLPFIKLFQGMKPDYAQCWRSNLLPPMYHYTIATQSYHG